MFERLKTQIQRKAKGATPFRHKAVFYDVRISNVEPEVQRVRMGWILGKGRPEQWCAHTHQPWSPAGIVHGWTVYGGVWPLAHVPVCSRQSPFRSSSLTRSVGCAGVTSTLLTAPQC